MTDITYCSKDCNAEKSHLKKKRDVHKSNPLYLHNRKLIESKLYGIELP